MSDRVGGQHHVLARERRFTSPVASLSIGRRRKGTLTMTEAQRQEGEGAKPQPRRSGSERRQKQRRMTFRLSEDEYQQLESYAEREGLTIGSYVRSRVLTTPTTRAIRRPVAEVELLRRFLSELHKLGSNHNQIAKRINMGETPLATELRSSLAACGELARRVTGILNRNGG